MTGHPRHPPGSERLASLIASHLTVPSIAGRIMRNVVWLFLIDMFIYVMRCLYVCVICYSVVIAAVMHPLSLISASSSTHTSVRV